MHSGELNAAVDHGANAVAPSVATQAEALGGHGVFALFSGDGKTLFAAAADGRVKVIPEEGATRELDLDAMPLVAVRYGTGAVLVGTDDGRVLRLEADGAPRTFHTGSGWVEQVAVDAQARQVAVASGTRITLLAGEGRITRQLDAPPSTPSGLQFGPGGETLAVAHYGGVTVWNLDGGTETRLHWHGSHTRLAWSPGGRFIVTATQDNELHAWRMPEGRSLKMSGYPAKIRSLSWTPDGNYLACAGADTVTCWDFSGDGPAGSAPLEFGYVYDGLVVAVAAHPGAGAVAAGYDNGSVLVGTLADGEALIARAGGGGPVTALDWAPCGMRLAVATADGALDVLRFAPGALGT